MYEPYKTYRIGPFSTSEKEIKDILKAWIAISIAFAIARSGLSLLNPLYIGGFLVLFLISALTAGIGFLLHELGHKVVAQKYGCAAEFRSFDQMLLLAVLVSFLGFIFAAPGAVMIGGRRVDRDKNGKISVAGPLINYVIAGIFLLLNLVWSSSVFVYGAEINVWLGLFNLIPLGPFDGRKIFDWNKIVWGIMLVVGFAALFL